MSWHGDDLSERSKSHKKKEEPKRKATMVFAAEPDAKGTRRDSPEPGERNDDHRLFCIYHNRHDHSTETCFDLKRPSKEREQAEGSGRHGRGRGYRGGGRKGGYQKPLRN